MISHKHRFIFIHIPKTGGNSIQAVLAPVSDDKIRVRVDHQDGLERFGVRGRFTPFKHVELDYYAQRVKVETFVVVACARHPIDRLLSSYFAPKNWAVKRRDDTWRHEIAHWDRERFLANLLEPAADFLKVGGVFRAPDVLLRFDTLQADFAAFLHQTGIPVSAALPKLNAGPEVGDAYAIARRDPLLYEIARSRYREDFERFGFDLP